MSKLLLDTRCHPSEMHCGADLVKHISDVNNWYVFADYAMCSTQLPTQLFTNSPNLCHMPSNPSTSGWGCTNHHNQQPGDQMPSQALGEHHSRSLLPHGEMVQSPLLLPLHHPQLGLRSCCRAFPVGYGLQHHCLDRITVFVECLKLDTVYIYDCH